MFENFISLGNSCRTAASMQKYGLRSWSGPLDWLLTHELQGVLRLIENEFEDFLSKEYLEKDPKNYGQFKNTKYDIEFIHETEYRDRYEDLCEKYFHRISRFKKEIEKRTCFLRTVTNDKELRYIHQEEKYIKSVIKKGNQGNEIIFLLTKNIKAPEEAKFPYYNIQSLDYSNTRDALRNWFDDSDEFIEYCVTNFSSYRLLKNIMFDRKKEEQNYEIIKGRYDLLVKLLNFDFNKNQIHHNLIIYGAGNIGKYFYEKVKEKCFVKCFLDKNKAGEMVGDIPVIWLNELKEVNDYCFVITCTYDYRNACKIIREYFQNAFVLSLEDILL